MWIKRTVPYCPLLSLTVPYCPLLSLTVPYYPLLSLTLPYYPLLSLTVPYCPLLSLTVPYHPPLQHKTYPECLVRTTRYSSTRLTLASTVASKSKVTTRIKTQTVKLSTSVGTMALAPWLSTASFAPTELCLISNTSFVTGGSMLIVLRWDVKAQN